MAEAIRPRPRVLVVSLGRRGGVTKYGQLMAQALRASCDVAAITSSGAANRDMWPPLGIPHLEVDTFSSVATMLLSFLAIPRFARMRRFAAAFGPDVIYYPGGHAWKPVLDWLFTRSAPTVLTVHDPELHSGENSIAHRLLDSANRLHVDGYVLLNQAQVPAFLDRNRIEPTATRVIPHGIFDDSVEARRPLDEVEGLTDLSRLTRRYVLFVGRVQHYKGVGTLLEAYRAIPEDYRPPLVIAGSGEFSAEERSMLDSFAPGQVRVENRWLSEVEISSLVGAARFVVLPYLSATQSGVIPLASAFGTPAIASDTGGLAEQVRAGETGLLFPPGDSQALARTIERAFALDDAEYEAMSSACRTLATTEWAWSVLAKRLVDFFDTLRLSGRR